MNDRPTGNEPTQNDLLFAFRVAYRNENGMRSRYNLSGLLRAIQAEDRTLIEVPNLTGVRNPRIDFLRVAALNGSRLEGFPENEKFIFHQVLAVAKRDDETGKVALFEKLLNAIVRFDLEEAHYVLPD